MQRLLLRCRCPQSHHRWRVAPTAVRVHQGASLALSTRAGEAGGGSGGAAAGASATEGKSRSPNVSDAELEKFRHLEK